jgi:hypothetical protein
MHHLLNVVGRRFIEAGKEELAEDREYAIGPVSRHNQEPVERLAFVVAPEPAECPHQVVGEHRVTPGSAVDDRIARVHQPYLPVTDGGPVDVHVGESDQSAVTVAKQQHPVLRVQVCVELLLRRVLELGTIQLVHLRPG